LKLYDCATAPSPRRVRIFLAEKGLTVPTVQVDLRNGEQFTPAFRALNPACTVPVLELDDLSPFFHPAMSRALVSFEPVWLGDATGRGAEPPGSSSAPARCIREALSWA
jgi:hypothetical protein